MKKSDKEIILEYLIKYKTLTALEAWKNWNILTSLRSRISDLRKEGYLIETEMITENKKTFAKYIYKPEARQLKLL